MSQNSDQPFPATQPKNMTKKSRRGHKNKKNAAPPATKGMTINLTLLIALFCVLSVFIPWALEALEYDLPAGVRGASTWIGLAGLCVFAASIYRARR